MSDLAKQAALKRLRKIPGVGKVIAKDLYDLGFRAVEDLKGQDPEKLYAEHCLQKGMKVDRCMLYVFRLAVYYASNGKHDPELLKWYNWKDAK
jgi:hypothetical protein